MKVFHLSGWGDFPVGCYISEKFYPRVGLFPRKLYPGSIHRKSGEDFYGGGFCDTPAYRVRVLVVKVSRTLVVTEVNKAQIGTLP